MADGSRGSTEITVISVLGAVGLFMGALLWFVMSPLLGPIYRMMRLVETLGLWGFSGWGRYFQSVPWRSAFEFKSLFLSSVPFGVFFAFIIVLVGYLAWEKVRTEHIDVHVQHDRPPSYKDVMQKNAVLYPHNDFYAHFDMAIYPQDRGPAMQGMTEEEFLREAGALFISQSDGALIVDTERAAAGLKGRFGPVNPFLKVVVRQEQGLRFLGDPQKVERAVAALQWHHVVVLAPALARMYALLGYESGEDGDAGFKLTVTRADEFVLQLWREIMSAVRASKRTVVLGRFDGDPFPDDVVTLGELLASQAEAFPTVIAARATLLRMLGASPDLDERSARKDLLPVPARTEKASRLMANIVGSHGYLFGVIARSLEETRAGGIFPPNGFNWMRFVDQPLWRFLLYVGMKVAAPDAAGMFEHYCAERQHGGAYLEPYIDDAPRALERECRKYVINTDGLPRR